MPDILNRTTKQFRQSVSQVEYSIVDWIEDPDLSAVVGFQSKHWIITDDVVSLMDETARNAVDAAELENQRDNATNQLDQLEDLCRAFALAVLDEFNVLRAQHSLPDRTIAQLKTAVRNKLGT